MVYGPLANGATSLMYEGAPNFPEPDRFWRIVEKYGVTILYTAPTAIRAFMKWGDEWPQKHDLSSLRLLGTVGEPINPEAWMWYHEVIGGKRCPIVDTWWQTETGGIMITPLPGATPTKPGSATLPFFGIVPEVVDDYGTAGAAQHRRQARHPQTVARHAARPLGRPAALPASLLERSRRQLLHRRRLPAGQGRLFLDRRPHRRRAQRRRPPHRHRRSRERAGQPSEGRRSRRGGPARRHEGPGAGRLRHRSRRGVQADAATCARNCASTSAKEIGPVAKPDDIRFAEALPKTRSGKIMRRLLKQIAAGTEIKGDTTTLEDLSVLARLSHVEE